ncbi:MAG: ABC transporter substrate-binding protein [Chloroflexi bacterium]|nr:ABC transporter substrate-binding protein [Chloroflexota bacterium]
MSRTGGFLILIMVAMLVITTLLPACAPKAPPQQFTLRISFIPIVESLPYFVMQEQGFAAKNGLQFQETPSPGGNVLIEAMVAGSVDGSNLIGSMSLLLAAQQGLVPDKIITVAANSFADPDHPLGAVLSASSVNSWQDLRGQQIAVPLIKGPAGVAISGRMQIEGVADYKLVEIPYANQGLAVAGGNVAAAVMPEPWLTQSLLRKDGKLLGWIIGGPPFERVQNTMIPFSADFYRNNPEAVKAYLLAQLHAVKWIDQNPEKARAILARRMSLSPEVGQKMSLPRFSSDGRNDPVLLESMQPVLINAGLLKAPIPARQLYDETLLNEVLKERR